MARGPREAAREKAQAEHGKRTQRWDTDRERLIELRVLLDTAGVTLIACEDALAEMLDDTVRGQWPDAEIDEADRAAKEEPATPTATASPAFISSG